MTGLSLWSQVLLLEGMRDISFRNETPNFFNSSSVCFSISLLFILSFSLSYCFVFVHLTNGSSFYFHFNFLPRKVQSYIFTGCLFRLISTENTTLCIEQQRCYLIRKFRAWNEIQPTTCSAIKSSNFQTATSYQYASQKPTTSVTMNAQSGVFSQPEWNATIHIFELVLTRTRNSRFYESGWLPPQLARQPRVYIRFEYFKR